MVNVSNVSTTENTYKPAVQGGQKAAAPNSIYTVQQPQTESVEENKNTSKVDELLEKLCAELSKLGLDPAELKNSGILFRITGMNEQQINAASEQELKQIIDCLKTAIKDAVVDGKVDLEKAGKLGNRYYIALKTGWDSIEQYKKNQQGESLSARMERFFGLDKKGIKFSELPQAKVEEYLDRYFNEFFVEKLKAAKTPEEKQKIYKQQLQDFGKLLNNTPDSEKAIFKQAITSLVASNRVKGLDAVLASFDTPAARNEWANSWTVEDSKRFATKADVEGNVPEQEDVTEGTAKVVQYKDKEHIEEFHNEFHQDAKTFFEENKDALAKIAEKEAKGEELTEEEKQLKLERDNYFTAVAAGEISGTAINEIIEEAAKKELLGTMNKDAYELPNYKEVLEQVSEFIENNPEALTMPKEELVKLLDEATNGNYSTAASGSNAEFKAPANKEEAKEAETPDYGFVQKQTVDTTRLQVMQQQIAASTETEETFTVEKPVEEKISTAEVYTLKNQAFRSASNIETYLQETGETKFGFATEVFKKFNDMGSTTQAWAMNYFSNASSAVQNLFLNKITDSVSGMVAAAKEVDLSKFNLIGVSVTTQNQIDKIQDERGLV